jgi:hypothetical protein
VKNCPKCKLVCPDDSQRCDFGYDFETGQIETSFNSRLKEGIPVEDLPVAKGRSMLWLAACVGVLIFGAILKITGFLSFQAGLGLTLAHIITCSRYAVAKGHGWEWGLFGFFSVLGLIILITKPYKVRGT